MGPGSPYPADGRQTMFETEGELDAYAPALHVSPGRVFDEAFFPCSQIDEHAIVGVLYKQ